jgi:hypothetical protein
MAPKGVRAEGKRMDETRIKTLAHVPYCRMPYAFRAITTQYHQWLLAKEIEQVIRQAIEEAGESEGTGAEGNWAQSA